MKRTELRRLTGALLALVMALGMLPGAVKQANAENETTVPALGQDETEIQPVVNKENPVDYIEVVSPAAMTLIENMGGGWYTRWDSETESYVPYFDYYLDASAIQIAIHYKDGTLTTASPYDEVDGYWVEYIDTQNQNPWEIGKSNIATISYRDRKTTIPVVIEEHPVDYMELIGPTPVTLIGGVDIDWVYTWDEAAGQSQIAYFYYSLKYAGVQVAIHFKDGAVKTASIGDEVDGYGVYDASWDAQYESPWEVGNTYTGTISYMDRELSVPVSIIFPYYPIAGSCGDSLTWRMTDDGELTVSGTGAMWDRLDILHSNMFDRASTVQITEGVTAIGNAFARLRNLTSVTFTGAAPSFADDAFTGVAATVYYPASDPTWTEDVRQNYGGVLTWVPYDEPEPAALTGIAVAALPAKTVYELGETLDTTALTLIASYSDGVTELVTDGFAVSGFDSAAAGEKTVTITYEGKTASFTVTVNESAPVTPPDPADPDAPKIVVESKKARAGSTVDVDIALQNNPGVASLKLKAAYGDDLALTKVQYNDSIGGISQQPQSLNSPVTLNWYSGATDAAGDWTFVTLTFAVSESAVGGTVNDIAVTYDPEDVYNIGEDNIAFAVVSGAVTVISHIPGDINGDGKVNNKDLTRLFQYLSDWDVEVVETALDVNGDKKVNNKDLTRLFQYLSDWDVEIF